MGQKKPVKSSVEPGHPLVTAQGGGTGSDIPATPRIDSPLANAFVQPGANLAVSVSTNRGDLNYIVEITDVGPPPGVPVTANIAPPGPGGFTHTIPGVNLAMNRVYTLRVFVNPVDGPPPAHMQHSLQVHTSPPPAPPPGG